MDFENMPINEQFFAGCDKASLLPGLQAEGQCAAEIRRLRAALEVAVRQNEHDMLMTGEELRACRKALEE